MQKDHNDMSDFTYLLLPQLPTLPQELVDLIDRNADPLDHNISQVCIRVLDDWNGQYGSALRNVGRYDEPFQSEFVKWFKENIASTFLNTRVTYTHGGNWADDPFSKVISTGAHCDITRDYVLAYAVDTGGDDAELVFWKEDDHDVYRERGVMMSSTRSLQKIDSVKVPAGSWYLINSRVLHSTENLSRKRITVQASFDTQLPPEILNKISQ
ncbi:hypothetical protein [Haliscomenobacter sp.]|uniref:hypothetical protein n=1 Tax=Haliscomenobacter sp. TaxID=2717303 RepID=UPI003364CFB8